MAFVTSVALSTAKFQLTVPTRWSGLSGDTAEAFASAAFFGWPALTAPATTCLRWASAAVTGLTNFVPGASWGVLAMSASSASTFLV